MFASRILRMAGGAGHAGKSSTAELHYHPTHPVLRYSATLLTGGMWFWMLYRAREDGPVLLGWRHPWEGHGHGHDHDDEADHHHD
ncbi:hypothetical protein PYCC9005_004342 [Savitreella phatthalungensis]